MDQGCCQVLGLVKRWENPNSKHQIPNKYKNSNFKLLKLLWIDYFILNLVLDIWILFGIWCLEFGILPTNFANFIETFRSCALPG